MFWFWRRNKTLEYYIYTVQRYKVSNIIYSQLKFIICLRLFSHKLRLMRTFNLLMTNGKLRFFPTEEKLKNIPLFNYILLRQDHFQPFILKILSENLPKYCIQFQYSIFIDFKVYKVYFLIHFDEIFVWQVVAGQKL
jgi:hypothetical protein